MTIAEWLATRTPSPPLALMDRVREALGRASEEDCSLAADRCVEAAERIVAGLLEAGRTSRESAADLLTADALVTYAFEAASDDPCTLVERARGAMTRLARLGALEAAEPGRAGIADPSCR